MTARLPVRGPFAEAWLLTAALVRNRALAIRRDWKSRSLYGFAVFLGITVFSLILAGSYAGVRVLQAASANGLLESIPAWAFLIYLFTDILIAFGQALGDLYISRDMPILLSMPLRIPNIIIAKFTLGVAQNEVYCAIFLLPFALGYLLGVGAPIWTFLVAAAAIAVFPATLYAALIVVTIVALRLIPPRIAKEGLWLIGASVPTVFWFLSFYRVAHLTGRITTMRLPATPDWLPSTWVGNAITMLGSGDIQGAFSWITVLALVTFIACPAAMVFVSRSFAAGWSAAITAPAKRRSAGRQGGGLLPPSAALAIKDVKTFVRSPQLWFNHIATLGFVGYLLVGHKYQTPLLPLTPQLAMTQVGFVALLGSLNPGMTALSLEHLAVWILKSSPFRSGDILLAKLVVAYAQTAVVAALGAVALAYGYQFSAAMTLLLILFGCCAAAGAICVGIAFDAAYPCFTWENPNHINRGLRMVIPFLINGLVLAACAGVLFAARPLASPRVALAAGSLACAALQLACAAVALRMAHRDIEALEV
jgi:hypothetical protein